MTKVTEYKGISKFYFNKIIFEIIKIGKLDKRSLKILDYGCGTKQLSKILNKKIFNYDILKKYNEVEKLQFSEYDIIVFNHVLMYLYPHEINNLLRTIYLKNKECEIIIGVGKQNLISKILKFISFNFNAHKGTKSNYKEQLKIINKMQIINFKKDIYFMTDLYHLNLLNYDKISKSLTSK